MNAKKENTDGNKSTERDEGEENENDKDVHDRGRSKNRRSRELFVHFPYSLRLFT